jgi:sulfur-carrier protein
MKVNFYATLRDITGQKTVEIDLPEDASIHQLLEIMITRYPPLRSKLLQENGELFGFVHVFINGRDAPFLDDQLETILKPTDAISIFPAVGGG